MSIGNSIAKKERRKKNTQTKASAATSNHAETCKATSVKYIRMEQKNKRLLIYNKFMQMRVNSAEAGEIK